MHRRRYAVVPWGLVRQTDLEPQGEPETLVEAHRMRVFGLLIKAGDALLPDGASHAMLAIRAVDSAAPGGDITIAIAATLPFKPTTVNVQSNPVRHPERPTDHGEQ